MKHLKKHSPEILWGILLCVSIGLSMSINLLSGTADTFDFTVFRYQDTPPSEEIIIVALDDKSINHPDFKRYQDISRGDYAEVLETIFQGNPKAVGLDIFFYNESEDKAADQQLSEFFQSHPNLITVNEFDFETGRFLEPAETLNIKNYQRGYATLVPSSFHDKILINQTPLIFDKNNVEAALFEPFIFKIFRVLENGPQKAKWDADAQIYTIFRGKDQTAVPYQTIDNQAININFYGPPHSFTEISFYDLWAGNIEPQVFDNKIVLIGATAKDIHDEFFTPTSDMDYMPGVEIHAHLLQTLMQQDFIYYPSVWMKILSVFVIIGFLYVGFLKWNFKRGSLFGIFILAVYYGISIILFHFWGWVISIFWPIFGGLLFLSGIYGIRYIKSEKQKQALRDTFSQYVSPDIVHQILEHPELVKLGGESRDITAFFSDLEGFTNISESLTPEAVMDFLNSYLDRMSSLILEQKGTIDKFMGDGIMAFWGAPLDCPGHARLACHAALMQQKALPEINQILKNKGLPTISVRTGINSGSANIGNIGTRQKVEYTAIGDTVNLAARLESINKQYQTHIIISENTRKALPEDYIVRKLDRIRVKGKSKSVEIYELMGFAEDITLEQKKVITMYEKGLAWYQKQEWKKATNEFEKIASDPPAQKMIERICILSLETLPKDWDGAFTFEVK